MIDYIKVLDKNQVEECKDILTRLEECYSQFPKNYFLSTLGAATYQHCTEREGKCDRNLYIEIKNKINPILFDNFSWLYQILIHKIQDLTKEKCLISEEAELGFPGFHILYAHENSDKVTEAIHLDRQWDFHLESLCKIFKEVDCNHFLTFTLCIKLPLGGGGLYYWPLKNEDYKYSYDEADLEYNKLKELSWEIAPFNTDDSFIGCDRQHYEKTLHPKIINYKEGWMTFFSKPVLHQVMPFISPFNINDRRITLQGHGIKCDNIWRLYF